jgi:uncharacterized membrane protein YhaH (DUF805 family)
MDPLALLFSWSGRLAPRAFAVAIIGVYLVSFFSQMLLGAPVTGQVGLWPFALLQAALVWAWTVLHVKRLRDAGRPPGLAVGIAGLYILALLLLLLVMVMITASETSGDVARTGQGLIRFFLVIYLFAALFGSSEFGVLLYWLMGLVALLLLPVAIALCFSIWTGTRPSAPPSP